MSDARARILDAAWREIEARGALASMRRIADAVGISRQAVYLHFPGRAALLLALVEHVDARTDLEAGLARIEVSPDATSALRALAELQATHNPRIAAVARVLDAERHRDEAAAGAWADRLAHRRTGTTDLIRRLVAEGLVHPGWDEGEAATLLWELHSFRVWDDLVSVAGLAPDRYVELVTHVARQVLGSPPP